MPRTKKHQSEPPSKPQQPPASLNDPSGEVLTLAEAAAYLRFQEAEVVLLVNAQGLPGRSIASEWRFLRSAVQQWLADVLANVGRTLEDRDPGAGGKA